MATYEEFASIQNVVQTYVNDAGKQFNLGWTVNRLWYVLAFLIGVLLLVVGHLLFALDSEYKNNTKSKTAICVVCFIGIALIIFGLWSTIARFYEVAKRIEFHANNVPNSPFFSSFDGPTATVDRVVSDATLPGKVDRLIAERSVSARASRPEPQATNVIRVSEVDAPARTPSGTPRLAPARRPSGSFFEA